MKFLNYHDHLKAVLDAKGTTKVLTNVSIKLEQDFIGLQLGEATILRRTHQDFQSTICQESFVGNRQSGSLKLGPF